MRKLYVVYRYVPYLKKYDWSMLDCSLERCGNRFDEINGPALIVEIESQKKFQRKLERFGLAGLKVVRKK